MAGVPQELLWETFAMEMPVPDSAIITRKDAIVAGLKAILPEPEAVISDPNETRAYECDALTAYRCQPLAVVLPATTEEVAAVLKFCHEEGVPVVPRGAGTSLAGGSLPTADSIDAGGVAHERRARNQLCRPLHPGTDRAHQPVGHRRG
jgi:hypothetical protein